MPKSALLGASSALAISIGLFASPTFAATASAADSASTGAAVSEITVVAEKREQSIETVPVAITAFGAEQRKLMGIAIIQDLADFSPSLNWTDIDDRVYIRGIGRNSDNLNNTSGVAIYYNGIYYGANAAIEQQKSDLFIGNIEVDNGPQNTLHGSNADGGIVSFTSQKPTDTMYGEVRGGVSNYNTDFVESVVSGPINDHLKFRLGGNFTEQRGGFFNNIAPGSPQGGNLVLGGSGETHYFEGQLEGHWDKLDAWIQASSGNFIANTHGAAAIGNFPATPFTDADTLTPNGFYGLCGIPGFAATGERRRLRRRTADRARYPSSPAGHGQPVPGQQPRQPQSPQLHQRGQRDQYHAGGRADLGARHLSPALARHRLPRRLPELPLHPAHPQPAGRRRSTPAWSRSRRPGPGGPGGNG